MSLTGLLASSTSRVGVMVREALPKTSEWVAGINLQLKTAPLLVIPTRGMQATVAAAFDYRARFFFEAPIVTELVAYAGARAIRHPATRTFFTSFSEFLAQTSPVGRVLAPEDEEKLARYCIVLAWFEQCLRGGVDAYLGTPLSRLRSARELIDEVTEPVARETAELARVFQERNRVLFSRSVVCNPTFDGSPAVGGADADLIVDRCLIELKCRERCSIDGMDAYQLFGYALLDFGDRYHINAVAIYLARHGVWLEWPLSEWLGALGAQIGTNGLQELRDELAGLLGLRRRQLK